MLLIWKNLFCKLSELFIKKILSSELDDFLIYCQSHHLFTVLNKFIVIDNWWSVI